MMPEPDLEEVLGNTWTKDKEPLVQAIKKSASIQRANAVSQRVTGKDFAPAEIDWKAWEPILRKLAVLLITVAGTFAAGSAEKGSAGDLKATESTAGEVVKTDLAYQTEADNLNTAIDYYTRREIACDLAIEMFSRHREDDRDFGVVIQKCHSVGSIEEGT